jgi:hypothetical protein
MSSSADPPGRRECLELLWPLLRLVRDGFAADQRWRSRPRLPKPRSPRRGDAQSARGVPPARRSRACRGRRLLRAPDTVPRSRPTAPRSLPARDIMPAPSPRRLWTLLRTAANLSRLELFGFRTSEPDPLQPYVRRPSREARAPVPNALELPLRVEHELYSPFDESIPHFRQRSYVRARLTALQARKRACTQPRRCGEVFLSEASKDSSCGEEPW